MLDLPIRTRLGALLLVLATAAGSGPSWAQTPPAEAPQPAAAEAKAAEEAEPEVVLDTIVVTAQKREENIQKVPISITTFDAEQFRLLTGGAADVKFLSGRVPSLVLESSFGRAFPRFYIRGLGNTDFDLNASQPVSMVVDEVVLENPVVKGMPLFDMERVEVLRGPQGTFFGRNTPAGVVKFDTVKPSDEESGYMRASYGTFDNIDVQAAYGGGSETFSARASVLYQSQSDWVDNGFTGEKNALGGFDTTAARLQFMWTPNDKFDALLNLHGWSLDGTARIFRANILNKGSNDFADDFEQDTVYQDGLNDQTIDAYGGSFKFDYDFGGAKLTSVTGYETISKMYSRGDIDGGFGAVYAPPFGPGFIPFVSESADGIPNLDQFTEELRLAGKASDTIDWLFGLFYFDESFTAETFSYNSLAPGNPQDGYAFQTQDTTSWAAFTSWDFRPIEHWLFKAGLRYTTEEKDFAAERPDPTFQLPTDGPIQVSTDADLVTWDLSATWEASAQTNFYGRIGTGFRAPSIQGRILFCADFEGGNNPATNCVSIADEEEILSTEIGMKTESADRKVRLNLAVYDFKVDGQQIVAVGGQYNTATLLNADTTNGYGFEANLDWAPSQYWLITLGGSYNHTDIDDPNLLVAPCGGGCTVTDPFVNGLAKVDGNALPNAPEWIFDGIIDFRMPAGDGVFFSSLDWAYQSEKSFFLYESKEFNGDSFEVGLRAGYTFAEAKYELALFARNLLDEEILQGAIDFDNLTGMTNEPRLIGIEFSTRF